MERVFPQIVPMFNLHLLGDLFVSPDAHDD
jgi:hypothetical protein